MIDDDTKRREKEPGEQEASYENLIKLLGLTKEQADVVWSDMVTSRESRDYAGGLTNAMRFLGCTDIEREGRLYYIAGIDQKGNRIKDFWSLYVDHWTGEHFIDKA